MNSTMQRWILSLLLCAAWRSIADAEELSSRELPFDRQRINRYSLDHLPRSISIRQGEDTWLGYDLQRAKLYKLWRAPEGEVGLKQSGFVMRSVGVTTFADKSNETWKLQLGGEATAISIRYLGCSERASHFELRWELTHGADAMTLRERVPITAATRVTREIQVEGLPAGSQLLLPMSAQQGWNLMTTEGTPVASLTDAQWFRLTSH
jgi:hypothetical protein